MKRDTKASYLIAGRRTPIGSQGKSLAQFTARELFGLVLADLLPRLAEMAPGVEIDEFIASQAFQNGNEPNNARLAWLDAKGHEPTPASTVQMQCGGGMKAIHFGMRAIAGGADLVVAGGGDSMSNPAYLAPAALRQKTGLNRLFGKWIPALGPRIHVGLVDDGLCPLGLRNDETTVAMARTAERLAQMFGISRQRMDEFVLLSQMRAAAALAENRFETEIVPVLTRRGAFYKDEHPRKTKMEKLAGLKGVLGTSLTAAQSSGICDGAAFVAIASEAFVDRHQIIPEGILVDGITVGLDPRTMGLGPVFAARKLLERNGLSIGDIDLWELNEAFAPQALACMDALGLSSDNVNVNGGAIAYGHPIAMTGARITMTLLRELKARKLKDGLDRYGIATACVGGGMGIATLAKTA